MKTFLFVHPELWFVQALLLPNGFCTASVEFLIESSKEFELVFEESYLSLIDQDWEVISIILTSGEFESEVLTFAEDKGIPVSKISKNNPAVVRLLNDIAGYSPSQALH